MKYPSRNILPVVALVALTSQTDAFSHTRPIRSSLLQNGLSSLEAAKPCFAPHRPKRNFHLSNSRQHPEDEHGWIANAAKWIKEGSSRLKNAVTKTANVVKSAMDSSQNESVTSEEAKQLEFDTQDEELFRSLLEKEDRIPDKSISISSLVDQAAEILRQDEEVNAVLGQSIRHGNPFAESQKTSVVDGKVSTSTETKFDVWGLRGQGLVTLSALDNQLLTLHLHVDGKNYNINPASRTRISPQKPNGVWEPDVDDVVLEVEVVEGVRRLNPPKGSRVIDAEILDKVFM